MDKVISNMLNAGGLQNKKIRCMALIDIEYHSTMERIVQEENWEFYIVAEELESVGNLSLEHYLSIIKEHKINLIVTQEKYNHTSNRLLWYAEDVITCFYLDTNNPYHCEKNHSMLMNKKLWDAVALSASDEIEGGGWVSSYTRKHFSCAEMEEFSQNVYLKVKDILGKAKDKKVLEIGCSTGITMFPLLPYVSEYVAIDLSKVNINKNKLKAQQLNIKNLFLYNISANDILDLKHRDFDLVIINSVVQCFPGVNYMRNVICNAIKMLKKQGSIFIGDVMDLDKKEILYNSLIEYKNKNSDQNTKIDLSEELFFDKNYFYDLQKSLLDIDSVIISDKIGAIRNELTNYRYDVLLTIHKDRKILIQNNNLHKYQLAKKLRF